MPITVKEAFNVAGLHTTWGNPAFKDYVADRDATVVARLRDAGAILLGKTNTHFMLGDFAQTFNNLYGHTNNLPDVHLTPGGSSGGSAAAVASGPIAHASLPGLPAVSAPIGRSSRGLPIGAQIVGPLHQDDTAITFAELITEIVGGYETPPSVCGSASHRR